MFTTYNKYEMLMDELSSRDLLDLKLKDTLLNCSVKVMLINQFCNDYINKSKKYLNINRNIDELVERDLDKMLKHLRET